MTESFSNIEDEAFPSFLSTSVGSSRATLGNVTLASTLGLPVAASTVAKIRAGSDNRVNAVQASYLEDGRFSLADSQSNNKEQGKFALSFKDELDAADDFIAAHRFSDMLVKVNLDQTEPRTRASSLGPNTQTGPLPGRHSEHGDGKHCTSYLGLWFQCGSVEHGGSNTRVQCGSVEHGASNTRVQCGSVEHGASNTRVLGSSVVL
eukprot:XP_014041542.1 PREDICTED: uncharacterized protein LOC106594670 isoform X2 [Salmo salar]